MCYCMMMNGTAIAAQHLMTKFVVSQADCQADRRPIHACYAEPGITLTATGVPQQSSCLHLHFCHTGACP